MSNTLRTLLKELRLVSPSGHIKDSLAANYILSQYKKYQTTDETLCKARDEMVFLGQTYSCYLQSKRNHERICVEYKGAGERSVQDTATMVGFKLPHDPK